jgi:two-component system, OmpR family, KDP operon response regulator KdpE
MNQPKILGIDDDVQIQRLLRKGLEGYGYKVSTSGNGSEGLMLAAQQAPDLVILDINLGSHPDGIEVCRDLRQWSKIPIIVLSVRDDKNIKLSALNAGADDYVVKPFDMDELDARIKAVLRRSVVSEATNANAEIHTGELTIDLAKRRVMVGQAEVHLTPKEYELLRLLATQPGKVLTYTTLLTAVWGEKHIGEQHYIRVFMNTLRKKLREDLINGPRYILTEPGIGYRFVDG